MRAFAAMLPFVMAEDLNFLSSTLGDHMVLQRAPQQAVVYGHTSPGAVVSTSFHGQILTATADVNGTWRQKLPATEASESAYALEFSSSSGEKGSLKDVLFGDVYLCGGQSNMVFSIPSTTNATQEEQLANAYPHIRLFTVGQGTRSHEPLGDLQTIEQHWSVANSSTVAQPGGGRFSYFSSVCWFFGRQIADALASEGNKVPIGLISSNWGGTQIERWSTPAAFEACGRTDYSGDLYNAMIHPYTVGPTALSGFTWYQGEQNTKSKESADAYACLFPAMITEWRHAFGNKDAYFGFVQLSTWCDHDGIPEMREAQMQALKLPKIGYATNADHGAGCNIHPPSKQFCGKRLGNSALAIQYGKQKQWRSPSYKFASATVKDGIATVSVTLADVGESGLTTDVYPANYVPKLICANNTNCAWASIELASGDSLNATVTASGSALLLQAAVPKGAVITASSYGWGPIPLMSAYDVVTQLPVLPWKRNLTSLMLV